jgi:hypothetical protein
MSAEQEPVAGEETWHAPAPRLPLKQRAGSFHKPQTNYSAFGDSITTLGPYKLGITRLECDKGHLEITIATDENWSATLTFEE